MGDEKVRIWDAVTHKLVRTLKGHNDGVNSVHFCPDGLKIVSASDDKTLRVWDVRTGECQQTIHDLGKVMSAQFSPDGQTIVSASGDSIRVWNAMTGESLQALEPTETQTAMRIRNCRFPACSLSVSLLEHEFSVFSARFSPDGQNIVSAGGHDRTVRIWDLATGECVRTLQGHTASVYSAEFSPDGRKVVSGALDGTVRIW